MDLKENRRPDNQAQLFKSEWLIYGIILLMVSSCIPNRKIIYLQTEVDKGLVKPSAEVKPYILQNQEYRLKPGDIISIKISSLTPKEYNFFADTEEQSREVGGDPALSGYMIDKNGFVNLPVLGKVSVNELTVSESQEKIEGKIEGYLQNASVIVRLMSFNYTILGEVRKPGRFTSYNSKINLFEGIAMANDLTDFADRRNVKVIRFENDQAHVFYVNLLEDELLYSSHFYLQPNDLIVVSPLKAKNVRQYQLPTYSIILSTITAVSLLVWRFGR